MFRRATASFESTSKMSILLSPTTFLTRSQTYLQQTSWFGGMLGGVRAKHSIKTNRSAYKRFRVKGNGQLKR